jgi:hypothetical protein
MEVVGLVMIMLMMVLVVVVEEEQLHIIAKLHLKIHCFILLELAELEMLVLQVMELKVVW